MLDHQYACSTRPGCQRDRGFALFWTKALGCKQVCNIMFHEICIRTVCLRYASQTTGNANSESSTFSTGIEGLQLPTQIIQRQGIPNSMPGHAAPYESKSHNVDRLRERYSSFDSYFRRLAVDMLCHSLQSVHRPLHDLKRLRSA